MKKIALVTGASSGIGKATAIKLADNGYNLILCGRRIHKLKELQTLLDKKIKSQILVFDIRNNSDIASQFESLPVEWRDIDVLINSAGNAYGLSSIEQNELEDWDAMIDSNVKGLLYMSKMIIPEMIRRKKGHIVNLSSTAGKQTYANGVVYCASKKAVEAISEGMRLDLTEHHIKVTNIAPGAVETEFSNVRFKGNQDKANQVYAGYEPLIANDIADAILYVLNAPERVTISDITLYPKAQASPTMIYRNL